MRKKGDVHNRGATLCPCRGTQHREAAVAKCDVGRKRRARLGRSFELHESWRDKPSSEIKRLHQHHLRVYVDGLFA